MASKNTVVKDFVSFYVTYFDGLAKSIKILSKFQNDHSEEYKSFKDIQIDPTKIYTVINNITDEDRRIMLDLLMRSSMIQAKFIKLFDMNSKQQMQFSAEIDKYLEDFRRAVD